MSEVLNVKVRDARGTKNACRMRRAGHVPAILYGHGKQNVCLAVPREQLEAVVRHGARVIELKGDVNESAFLREVQWDTFGLELLHVDFSRVEAGDSVEATIPVELKGEAPGSKEGGIVEHLVHEVTIDCPVSAVPEKLLVNINALELDGSVMAADLQLPDGAKLVTRPDTVLIHCVPVAPVREAEEAEVAPVEPVEPEVIGRKAEQETGEG
jgi:large subunit ribosomal protein L25